MCILFHPEHPNYFGPMRKFLSFAVVAAIMVFAYFKFVPENERFDLKKLFGGGSDSTISVVTASEAFIREKTDADSKLIATVHVGDTVENLGSSTEIVDGKELHYHKVRTKDGKKGWISDDLVGIGVLPAGIMRETQIFDKPGGSPIGKSFLTGDFVVAFSKVGDFVEVRGGGREEQTYNNEGNVTGFVPASVLTYDPLDISFATKHQRALDEKDQEIQDQMMAEVDNPDLWMKSDLFIALHSKPFDLENDSEADVIGRTGYEGDEADAIDEGAEEEDPGFGIMQMQLLPPKEGLVAHYEMDHIAVEDATGFHHNGTSYEVSFDHDKNGSAMAAWQFNGKNSYVTIDQWNDNKLEPPFTIAAYVKLSDIGTKLGTVASRGRSANGTGFNFGYGVKDNGARVFYFGMIGAQGPVSVEVPTKVPAEEWVFLAASYDTKTMKLYVNGVLAGSTTTTREDESMIVNYFEDSNEPLEIGRELASLGRYFSGSIDNLAIWNRALSDDEVAQMNH